MSKRLVKRHRRQVLRAKQRVRVSEPDLRSPEQIKAAREASHPTARYDYRRKSTPALRDKSGRTASTIDLAD